MLSISLELPEGVNPPTMKGTLTGPPDDLRIEIRLADFVAALGQAKDAGATVAMVPHGVVIDTPKPDAKKAAPTKRVAVVPAPGSAAVGSRPAPTQDAVLDHLRGGACTRVETIKATAQKCGVTLASAEQAFEKVKNKNLIEKFEDPNNGNLPKWRLPKGGQ